MPPLALLDEPKQQVSGYSQEALDALSRQVEFKLKDFRIEAQVVSAHPGPVITRFEMQPAPGIKGSQISSLDKQFIAGAKMYPGKGPTVDIATPLEVGARRRTAAAIGKLGEEDLFRFTAKTTGKHIVDTRGPTDMVMKLFGPDSPTALIADV